MIQKKSKQIFCVITLTLGLLLSCKPKEELPLAATGSLESNNWSTGCVSQSSVYVISTAQISSGSYVATLQVYSNSSCTTSVTKAEQSGTYIATGMDSLGNGSVDWTIGAYNVTPLSGSQVTSYNTSNFCGYNDWQLNVAKSVLARVCNSEQMPSAGDVSYDIYLIKQNSIPSMGDFAGDLTFGLSDSTNDGSTPSKRPTVYNGNLVYRQ